MSRNLHAHDVESGYLRDPAEQLANQKLDYPQTLEAGNTAELEAQSMRVFNRRCCFVHAMTAKIPNESIFA